MLMGSITNSCTICGSPARKSALCPRCYATWGNYGNFPYWLKELAKIHRSYERDPFYKFVITVEDMELIENNVR